MTDDPILSPVPGRRPTGRLTLPGRLAGHVAREAGVRDFVDIGSGPPLGEHTHAIVQREAPESRVVYVGSAPLTARHTDALLTSAPEGAAHYLRCDRRFPAATVEALRRVLDFTAPLAVVMRLAPDDRAYALIGPLVAAAPSGSHFAFAEPAVATPATSGAPREPAPFPGRLTWRDSSIGWSWWTSETVSETVSGA